MHILVLITLAHTISCTHKEEAKVQEADSLSLRIALLPCAECIPFYYADSLGIFDSLHVKVKLLTYESAMDADTAFVNGKADIEVTDLVKACLWVGNGDSIKVIMSGDLNMWLCTSPAARIIKVESIREKIIGTTRHSSVDFFTDKILESAKMSELDLNKPQINNMTLRAKMVDLNQYDGAILAEPFASEVEARGAKRLTSTSDLKLNGMMAVVARDSLLKTRNDEIRKIIKAYKIAAEAINSDTTDVLAYIPRDNGIYLPDTLYQRKAYRTNATPSDSLLQLINTWAKGRKLIKEDVTSERLFSKQIIQ